VDSLQNLLSAGKVDKKQRHVCALTQDGVSWVESLKQNFFFKSLKNMSYCVNSLAVKSQITHSVSSYFFFKFSAMFASHRST